MPGDRAGLFATAGTWDLVLNDLDIGSVRKPLAGIISLAIDRDDRDPDGCGEVRRTGIKADVSVAKPQQSAHLSNGVFACRIRALINVATEQIAHFGFLRTADNNDGAVDFGPHRTYKFHKVFHRPLIRFRLTAWGHG
jgi:hypothetical protein